MDASPERGATLIFLHKIPEICPEASKTLSIDAYVYYITIEGYLSFLRLPIMEKMHGQPPALALHRIVAQVFILGSTISVNHGPMNPASWEDTVRSAAEIHDLVSKDLPLIPGLLGLAKL